MASFQGIVKGRPSELNGAACPSTRPASDKLDVLEHVSREPWESERCGIVKHCRKNSMKYAGTAKFRGQGLATTHF